MIMIRMSFIKPISCMCLCVVHVKEPIGTWFDSKCTCTVALQGDESDDKVTVLESEKRAWENSPEAQAMREALNPWRNTDANARKPS
ncbi:hypothetical protein Hanom_Chr15g01345941 [Helianthus anomalus]